MTLTRTIRRRNQRKAAKTRPPRRPLTPFEEALFEEYIDCFSHDIAIVNRVNPEYKADEIQIGDTIRVSLPRSRRGMWPLP